MDQEKSNNNNNNHNNNHSVNATVNVVRELRAIHDDLMEINDKKQDKISTSVWATVMLTTIGE